MGTNGLRFSFNDTDNSYEKEGKEGERGKPSLFDHSHKKRIVCTYVENQAILEPILLYRTSKCKQTKEQGSEDCSWTHIFTFLKDYCQLFFFLMSRCKQNKIKLCYDRLQSVKETQTNTV